MIERVFYHNTIRRYTVAFGSIFNGIKIERQSKDGSVIDTIPIPLVYSTKEKFVTRGIATQNRDLRIQQTLPAMGFELTGVQYAANRKTNTMERIVDNKETKMKFMFNRVPYDFTFTLYIGARKIDDSLRIIEQILPYFTPELNIRMREMRDFPDIVSDIPVVLVDVSPQIDASESLEERRTVLWQLTFVMKGHLYTNVRDVSMIKKSIVELSDSDINSFYEGYMSTVDPLSSGEGDEYDVQEQITQESYESGVVHATDGTNTDVNLG